jgi:hypothetical protein
MLQLLERLKKSHPELRFTAGKTFSWSPETGEIIYKIGGTNERDRWALLHETGHALLEHHSYLTDIGLLKMEIAAWEKARTLAKEFAIIIDEDHIQDCLDTYRDWLHARAQCPSCATRCLQHDNGQDFRCHNCHTSWSVTTSRFCRPYRALNTAPDPVLL